MASTRSRASRILRASVRPLLYTTAASSVIAAGFYITYRPRNIPGSEDAAVPPPIYGDGGIFRLPDFPAIKPRAEQIADLKRSAATNASGDSKGGSWLNLGSSGKEATDTPVLPPADEPYDLLIIGAGATGTGIALDAATRGLRVAVVDRDDFSSGTSSKSTKLVHGGVRYLEKAFWELDYSQYKLVKDALRERRYFLDTAPHLSSWLPIMIPLDSWWKLPYFWAGTKMYDILAGSENIESSYFLTRSKALDAYPMLKKDALKGALVYYDGAHNDSRMNVSLAMTASLYGASVVNYVEVTSLTKDANGKLTGAMVKDLEPGLNGKATPEFQICAKGIINATGPFTDAIRKLDNAQIDSICAPSTGVHIMLPGYYSPSNMGLIDPSTSDGRVIFFLPWQGNTIAGTTDNSIQTVSQNPIATEDEINFILKEIRGYLQPDINVRRGDVLAAWSGIRPLVRDPKAKNTEGLVRAHLITTSDSGLITVAGGKWTTYREMAEEGVDAAISTFNLTPRTLSQPPRVSGTHIVDEAALFDGSCQTHQVKLVGAHGFSKTLFINLIQHFGLETEVAHHLTTSYGDRAWMVGALCAPTEERFPVRGKRISTLYPIVDGEVRYAVRHEYALTAVDVLARRTRLAFLNAQAALEALPGVIDLMSAELGWDKKREELEWKNTVQFLASMGLPAGKMSLTRKDVESGKARQYADEEYQLYARHDNPADVLESDKKFLTKIASEASLKK
ncbi:DAO-domain-containing protein [Microthyrium microscopicum]|uniref:glycerol-3-phosphate dehydrogenase n=1 Tax=Microthyrium microscopicum TaxID=703497 RepID=A0A6A6U0M3_9PEZI|nr:DAO-domain-containing protein [Microthyrium microscopicum]